MIRASRQCARSTSLYGGVSRTVHMAAGTQFSRVPKLSPIIVAAQSAQVRQFSNEDFKKTLEKMKQNFQKDKKEAAATAADKTAHTASKSAEASKEDTAEGTEGKEGKEGNEKEGVSNPFSKFSVPRFDVKQMRDWSFDAYDIVTDNVRQAYGEMMGHRKDSALTRHVEQAESFRRAKKDDEEEEDEDADADTPKETGPSALVHVKDPKSAWEAMKDRLQDSPLIREILRNSRKMGQQAAGTDLGKKAAEAGRTVTDKIDDAKEFWETSQNPLVYTISGVLDSIMGETEEGIAIKEIRKLDPKFVKEEWAQEVRETLAPKIIKAHLEGNTSVLKPWLGEGVFAKLAADISVRKHDGIVFDTNLLDLDENQIIMRFREDGGAVIVVVYMVQQLHCVRNKKGEILEGGEGEIRAKIYSMAFQQVYDDDDGIVMWKIVEYEFGGDMPYL
mmetsp:Transcript_2883/g.6683  ORF Transcript_2883/g.6683 Transcript_2883/m.6683 type:complete len:446 (+) Transcript_2883:119-1456(+)